MVRCGRYVEVVGLRSVKGRNRRKKEKKKEDKKVKREKLKVFLAAETKEESKRGIGRTEKVKHNLILFVEVQKREGRKEVFDDGIRSNKQKQEIV